jgi:hypothetical protein
LNVDFGRDAGARISVFERREARPAPPPPRLSVDTPAPQDTGTYRKPYNFATWIGLLRDAVDPAQPPSARDYIAAYTHPIPAGTFNRPYTCTGLPGNRNAQGIADENAGTACRYDAPDLPAGGGRFERGLRVDDTNDDLVVDLRFTPHDPHSTARLQDVSGFAFGEGDTLIAPHGAPFLGILHGDRLAALRWRAADVARLELRRTRGAEIVALTFAVRNPRLHLAIWEAPNATEALRLLRANRPDSSP